MGMSASRNAPGGPEGPPLLPGATPVGQMAPGQYPHLQNLSQNGPFGGILARAMMRNLEQRRLQQGMNPADWQAHLNSMNQPPLTPPLAAPAMPSAPTYGSPQLNPIAGHYRSY